jgi:hypothetical protein
MFLMKGEEMESYRLANATSILFIHNHPSGNTMPSIEEFLKKRVPSPGVLNQSPIIKFHHHINVV